MALRDLAERKAHLDARAADRAARRPDGRSVQDVFPPVRQPSMYGLGTTGRYRSYKAGGMVPYESSLELDFFTLMEWDYSVDTFVVQPFKVPYQLIDGPVQTYTPDVFVLSYPFFLGRHPKYEPTVYEIKPGSRIAEEWPTLKPKLRAAREFLRDAGFRFRLLTEVQLNPVMLRNIRFLLRYRGPRFLARTHREAQIVDTIIKVVQRGGVSKFTPRDLLPLVPKSLAEPDEVIPWIWNLYTDYVFQCDLFKPVTLDTVSWCCGDAGLHLENTGHPDFRADWRQPEHDWRR